MVSQADVDRQLKKSNIKLSRWGRSEILELANVLTENEKIGQVVNGYYENGFALLVSTDHRMLLIDKKPFNFLNVEDFRFDMINQLDYNHRLFNSSINVSAGPKNLQFTSFNQTGLRDLLNCVQCRMIEIKEEKKRAAEQQFSKLDRLDQTLKQYIKMQLAQASRPQIPEVSKAKVDLGTEAVENGAWDETMQRGEHAVDDMEYVKVGSLLPRTKVDLTAAKIAFAKLPWVISRRRREGF